MHLDINFNQQRAKSLGLGRLVGTRVSGVDPKSPAERANLQVNDVILEFNGVRIEQDMHLISLVKLTEIGRRVPLTVLRDGKLMSMDVEIADAQHGKVGRNVVDDYVRLTPLASSRRTMWSVTAAVSMSTATSIFGRLSGLRRRSNTVAP